METNIKPFLNEDFLLDNMMAQKLYHDYAEKMPIIDYHNHLPPKEIFENRTFDNLTQVWLDGDHYKWRAMRAYGIEEKFITGNGTDEEKFLKWAEVVPFTIRNPLYHWTHLELRRYFNIYELLTESTAHSIYEQSNKILNSGTHGAKDLLVKMNVKVICTTDDPLDDLRFHKEFARSEHGLKMLPAFRPDKAILIENEHFVEYIRKLGAVAGIEIKTYFDLLAALKERIEFFHANGCRISDHGLSNINYLSFKDSIVNSIFQDKLSGKQISQDQADAFKSSLLFELGKLYATKQWVMQLHLGAMRNNNKKMLRILGSDSGYDSIGDYNQAEGLSKFLSALEEVDCLPKTILYNLNPRDNEVMQSMTGNFNDGMIKGKIQYGSAWWFLDQKEGMEKQLNTLSNLGLLSCFIGMLTDSRSFLSFPRHEYFRRILCNLIGKDVHNGALPNDERFLGKVVQDICYHNAKEYFNL